MKWHSLLFISLLFGFWGIVSQHGYALSCPPSSVDQIVRDMEDDVYSVAFVGRVTGRTFSHNKRTIFDRINGRTGHNVYLPKVEVTNVFKGEVTEQHLLYPPSWPGNTMFTFFEGETYFVVGGLDQDGNVHPDVCNTRSIESIDVPLSIFGESYAPLPMTTNEVTSNRGVSRNFIALFGLGGAAGAWFVSRKMGKNDNKWDTKQKFNNG